MSSDGLVPMLPSRWQPSQGSTAQYIAFSSWGQLITEHGNIMLCKSCQKKNKSFFVIRHSRRTALLKRKDSSLCIVLVLAHASKWAVSLQKSQYITVSMIFVGCTSEKLIPNSAMRKKRQELCRVILLESPGDLADSGKLNCTDFNGCGLLCHGKWFLLFF